MVLGTLLHSGGFVSLPHPGFGVHAALEPLQVPSNWQVPPDGHVVLAAANLSGHAMEVPSQMSARSHAPALARQVNPFGRLTSTQAFEVPSQVSSPSHTSALARQVNPFGRLTSRHAFDDPSQVSATSQRSALARQVNPLGRLTSGHAFDDPSQVSATSHRSALARQLNPAGRLASGQATDDPSQVSATSHSPALARQFLPAAIGVQTPLMVPPAAVEHAWQSEVPPLHALEQQTPSTQKPEAQSLALVQVSVLTLTSNWPVLSLPAPSRTTQVTVVIPGKKAVPARGVQLTGQVRLVLPA